MENSKGVSGKCGFIFHTDVAGGQELIPDIKMTFKNEEEADEFNKQVSHKDIVNNNAAFIKWKEDHNNK